MMTERRKKTDAIATTTKTTIITRISGRNLLSTMFIPERQREREMGRTGVGVVRAARNTHLKSARIINKN